MQTFAKIYDPPPVSITAPQYQTRPVKKSSPMERKLCLYTRNGEKLKEMLTEDQAEQLEKTMDAYNEVLTQSEAEAFEFGFTLAARLLTDVMRSLELPSIDDI